jgi:hypothetical protein
MEKLRNQNMQMMTDIRENYQIELNKTRNHMERSVQDMKAVDSLDMQRIRDECQSRYR